MTVQTSSGGLHPERKTPQQRHPFLSVCTVSFSNHLTRSYSNRYSAYALEKDSARCGSLNPQGGQPPSVRYFFVRMSPFMGGTCGASSDAPVPCGRSANLQVLAHPFGRWVASDRTKHKEASHEPPAIPYPARFPGIPAY